MDESGAVFAKTEREKKNLYNLSFLKGTQAIYEMFGGILLGTIYNLWNIGSTLELSQGSLILNASSDSLPIQSWCRAMFTLVSHFSFEHIKLIS